MFVNKFVRFLLIAGLAVVFTATLSVSQFAQEKTGDGTEMQRLIVMRDKLDRIKHSLESIASALRVDNKGDKSKKDDKDNPDSPLGRALGLEKDANRLISDVANLTGKIDRGDKHDKGDVDSLEQAVNEFQQRVESYQNETATARAETDTPVGKDRDIKKKKKFLGLFGKGGNDEYDELIGTVSPGRDRELFIVATREVRKKNFDVGRLLYQTIITTYPDSPYLPMAKLAVADSFFLEGGSSSLIQAIGGYQDWLTFFPTHPLADRVVLKVAESEMRQIGLPDRDATRAKRAEVKLKSLMQQYPDSFLVPEAKKRLEQVQDNLGLHNLYIANYYYTNSVDQKKGGLKGAQSRYREILDKYPDFCFQDEVLYKLAVTYQLEEETDQAARYFQKIVSDYPNSDYVSKAKEQLELMGATVPAADPDRAKIEACAEPGFFANFKNQLFGIYPMTIDKDGVLLSKDFDKEKFELIDDVIQNGGTLNNNQIPKALTTVIETRPASSASNTPKTPPAPTVTPEK